MSHPASIHREKANAIEALFGRRKAVIGVIHASPPHDAHAIVTGQRTGDGVDFGQLETVRGSTSLPVLVGSGVTRDNIAGIFRFADAVIVASSLKREGSWWNEVEPFRVAAFMDVVKGLRG